MTNRVNGYERSSLRWIAIIFGLTLLYWISLSSVLSLECGTGFTSHNYNPVSPNLAQPNQNVTFPDVHVQNIVLPDTMPEEGAIIEISVLIENKDPLPYSGFQLVITLTEIVEDHGPEAIEPTVITFNKSLDIIPAQSTITDQISFTGEYGQYTLTGYLTLDGTIIPNSSFTILIQILGPPIGDIPSLLYALGGIFVFISIMALIPAVIDRFRSQLRDGHQDQSE